eukprot:2757856-Rhodomonas_salina.1
MVGGGQARDGGGGDEEEGVAMCGRKRQRRALQDSDNPAPAGRFRMGMPTGRIKLGFHLAPLPGYPGTRYPPRFWEVRLLALIANSPNFNLSAWSFRYSPTRPA